MQPDSPDRYHLDYRRRPHACSWPSRNRSREYGQRDGQRDGQRGVAARFAFGLAAMAAMPVALAHSIDGAGSAQWWRLWSFELWVSLPLLLSAALYAIGLRRLWSSSRRGGGISVAQAAMFWAGWLALVIGLVSPVDGLGGKLFWMHMVQHEVLMLVAAPLLVLGRPVPVWLWALPPQWRRGLGVAAAHPAWHGPWKQLSAPLQAWLLHALVLWGWHVPMLFQAAVTNEAVHVMQHVSFLVSALLFWWAIFQYRRAAGSVLIAACSLFTTAVHTAALGALLTFSSRVWYPVYGSTAPIYGFSALEDQQLGGLIMWVPGGLAYLLAALLLLWRLLPGDPVARTLSGDERRTSSNG